jgi:hypothetical protein
VSNLHQVADGGWQLPRWPGNPSVFSDIQNAEGDVRLAPFADLAGGLGRFVPVSHLSKAGVIISRARRAPQCTPTTLDTSEFPDAPGRPARERSTFAATAVQQCEVQATQVRWPHRLQPHRSEARHDMAVDKPAVRNSPRNMLQMPGARDRGAPCDRGLMAGPSRMRWRIASRIAPACVQLDKGSVETGKVRVFGEDTFEVLLGERLLAFGEIGAGAGQKC